MALNVPYQNQNLQPVVSLADSVGQWQTIKNQQQAAELARAQEQRLTDQSAREAKTGDLQFQMAQHKALKEVATDFRSNLQRKAQEMGLKQGTPEYQQLANAMFTNNYNSTFQNITGKSHQPGTDIDLSAIDAVAGMTPQEELQQKIEGQKAEWEAHLPYQMQVAQAQAGLQQEAQDRQFAHADESQRRQMQYDKDIKIMELESQGKNREAQQEQTMRGSNMNAEMKLADDFNAQTKDYRTTIDAGNKVKNALKSATTSAASTLSAGTAFMKLLDPGSVVRESELGMALAATGAFDRATNYLNVLQSGKVLTEEQVKDFQTTTDALLAAANENEKAAEETYRKRAQSYGLNPDNIIQTYGNQSAKIPPPMPQGADPQKWAEFLKTKGF
jgi:hypothetical protein